MEAPPLHGLLLAPPLHRSTGIAPSARPSSAALCGPRQASTSTSYMAERAGHDVHVEHKGKPALVFAAEWGCFRGAGHAGDLASTNLRSLGSTPRGGRAE